MTPPKNQAPGLVAELRRTPGWPTLGNAAADRITQLEAENAELRGKLEKAQAENLQRTDAAANYRATIRRLMDKLNAVSPGWNTEQANIRSPVQSEIKERFDPR